MLYEISIQILFQNECGDSVQFLIRIILNKELPSPSSRFHLHLGTEMFS